MFDGNKPIRVRSLRRRLAVRRGGRARMRGVRDGGPAAEPRGGARARRGARRDRARRRRRRARRRRARRQPRVWQRRHQGVRQSRARGFIALVGASFKRVKGSGGKRNTHGSRRGGALKKAACGAHRDFVLGRTHRRRGVRPRRRGDVRAIAGAGAARRRWRERHELERIHADPRWDARGDARAAFGAAAFVLGAVRGDARDAGRERGDPRGSGDARGRGRVVGLAPRRRRADVAGQDAPERRQRVRLSVPRAPEGDEPLPAGAGGAGGGSGDAENHAGEDSG